MARRVCKVERRQFLNRKKTYGYLNILGRNPLERELEKEGIMKNVHFLTEQEKMDLKACGWTSLGW